MATYLDFEENLQRIEEEIIVAKTKADEYAVATLEKKLQAEVEKTYGNLDDFQKLKLARHIDRPYA
jgi:acetyl-CoA carboxylase carboxyl transferase subunit alpha